MSSRSNAVVVFAIAALMGLFVLVRYAVASEPAGGATKAGKDGARHLDLNSFAVATILEGFAKNPETSTKDVRTVIEYDLEVGLWVLRNRSWRNDDMVECAETFVALKDISDAQAVEIAKLYNDWHPMQPKAFKMAVHGPVRDRVIAKMRARIKDKEAKKQIDEIEWNLSGEREEFLHPEQFHPEKLAPPARQREGSAPKTEPQPAPAATPAQEFAPVGGRLGSGRR
jgi:hypothetical protein